MRKATFIVAAVALACVSCGGCGGPRLEMPPSVISDNDEYVHPANASLEMVDGKQVVRVELTIFEELPGDLVYDLVTSGSEGDVTVRKNVGTGIKRDEPGVKTVDIPVEEALKGGKIVFHLLEEPAATGPAD